MSRTGLVTELKLRSRSPNVSRPATRDSGGTVEYRVSGHLTPTQRQAAVLDAAGADRTATADAVGVSEKTISRWRGQADFQRAVRDAQGDGSDLEQNVADFKAQLMVGAAEAARAVREMLRAEMAKDEPDPNVIAGMARVLVQKGSATAPARPTKPVPEVVTINISPELRAKRRQGQDPRAGDGPERHQQVLFGHHLHTRARGPPSARVGMTPEEATARLDELEVCAAEGQRRYSDALAATRAAQQTGADLAGPLAAYHAEVLHRQRDADADEARRLTLELILRTNDDGLLLEPLDPTVPARGLRVVDPGPARALEDAKRAADAARVERDASRPRSRTCSKRPTRRTEWAVSAMRSTARAQPSCVRRSPS